MAIIRNMAGQGIYIYAHDTAVDEPETGDAANITATISLDGAAPGATTDVNPTEIAGGVYWFDLTQGETNAAALSLIAVSATADVQLDPVLVLTQEVGIDTRAVPGDAMALTGAERTSLAGVVWGYATRTLTSFGTLVADVAAAVWGALTSALTTAGSIGKYVVDYLAAIRAKTGLLGSTAIAYAGPVLPNGNVRVIQGDAYEVADGLRLEWTDPDWNIDPAATLLVVLQDKTFFTGVYIDGITVGLELTSADTDALTEGRCDFYVVEVRSATKRITRQRGTWETLPKPTPTA